MHRMSHAMDVPARRSGEKWPRRGPYRCDPCASTSLLSPSLLADLTLSLTPSARGRLYPIQHAINREAMGERVVLSMACRMVAQFTKRSLGRALGVPETVLEIPRNWILAGAAHHESDAQRALLAAGDAGTVGEAIPTL